MRNETTRVTGVKMPKMKTTPIPKGKVVHIHVRFHDNGGNTVDSEHETPKTKGPKGPGNLLGMRQLTSHSAGFSNPKNAHQHIGTLMGLGAAGGEPGANTPPATPNPEQTPAAEPPGDEEEE